jgi:hypothetical protein
MVVAIGGVHGRAHDAVERNEVVHGEVYDVVEESK